MGLGRLQWLISGSVIVASCVAALCISDSKVLAQGCIPARHMSLSLGAEGLTYLAPGDWEGYVSYRFLNSDKVFIGNDHQPQLDPVGSQIDMHSIDLTATYALNRWFSLSLTLPFMTVDASVPHDDGIRHTMSAGGLGDVRFIANAWLLDPASHPNGNVTIGIGVKAPSGDDRASDTFFLGPGVTTDRPLDVSSQPGDGGWGLVVQAQAFQRLYRMFYGYASGMYLANPRDHNGVPRSSPRLAQVNSVPDQYLARLGFSYVAFPTAGISFSLGGRIDGMPKSDLIGDSTGFRRSGYAIYIDPGVNWTRGKNSFSVNVPVAVERYVRPGGGYGDYFVSAGYSRRF